MSYIHPLLRKLSENRLRRIKFVVTHSENSTLISATEKTKRKCLSAGITNETAGELTDLVELFYEFTKRRRSAANPFCNKWVVIICPEDNTIRIRGAADPSWFYSQYVHSKNKFSQFDPVPLEMSLLAVRSLRRSLQEFTRAVVGTPIPLPDVWESNSSFLSGGILNTTGRPVAIPGKSDLRLSLILKDPSKLNGLDGDHSGFRMLPSGDVIFWDAPTNTARIATEKELLDGISDT